MKDKVVVGVAGMPGSGKGAFRRTLQKMGYTVVIMGDEVREEVKRRNLKPTPENLGKVMLQLRESEGPAAVAKRCIPKGIQEKLSKFHSNFHPCISKNKVSAPVSKETKRRSQELGKLYGKGLERTRRRHGNCNRRR